MRDHDLALALAYALAPALAVSVYAHDLVLVSDGHGGFVPEPAAELRLPAVLIVSQSEALAGSHKFGKASVEITIESQADDDTSETHSQRVEAVAEQMADYAALVDACAIAGRVELLGKPCAIDTNPETEARAFRTPLAFRIGYAAKG